jgi:hypothetical protein
MSNIADPGADPEAPESSPDRVEIRRDARKRPVLDASLVLASQGVRHWIEFEGTVFLLTVEPRDAPRAR